MGNYQGCMCATPMVMDMEELGSVGIPPLLVTLLQAESGKIHELHKATTVAEVMLENPHQFVCHFNNILLFGGGGGGGGHLQSTRYFSALGADQQLQLGQWYILLPMHKLHKRIYPSDVDYFKSLLRAAYGHTNTNTNTNYQPFSSSSTTPRQSIITTNTNTNTTTTITNITPSPSTTPPSKPSISPNKVAPSSLSHPIQHEHGQEREHEHEQQQQQEQCCYGGHGYVEKNENDGNNIYEALPPPPPPFPFPSFCSLRSHSFPSENSDPSDLPSSQLLLQRNLGRCRSWVPKLETISEAAFA